MSRHTRTVVGVPPAWPGLHAGPEIDYYAELLLRDPSERTYWFSFRDLLTEAGWAPAEAHRCCRQIQRQAIACEHIAKAVRLLTVGPLAESECEWIDTYTLRYVSWRANLPIYVFDGNGDPRYRTDQIGGAAALPERIEVGERWIRLGWYGDPIPFRVQQSLARRRGATPRKNGSARQR